jgi:transposase
MDEGKRALWTKVVADFELSELSQRAYAEHKKIDLSNLRYWIYKLRNESRPLLTEERDPPSGAERTEQPAPAKAPPVASRLVPVRVVASPAPKGAGAVDGAGLLELALPSGARLRFPTGTDLGYLRQLVAAL